MTTKNLSTFVASALIAAAICIPACGGEKDKDKKTNGDGDSGDGDGGVFPGDGDAGNGMGFWEMGGASGSDGTPNEYSWDGSWTPTTFPVPGLLDETHSDLPPGKWGWDGSCNCPGDEGLAIYENEFVSKGIDFELLEDSDGELFGWRMVDTDGGGISLNHRGDNYDGTPGVDIFDLSLNGELAGTGPGDDTPGINLGPGPDMLRYGLGRSVDLRTGDALRGSDFDNDLVILGGEQVLGTNEYQIEGTTIHTGPGSDLVFARNFGPAAIDLGNGQSGRTDALDGTDGPDMAVLEGNMRDFRVYGGNGNDVFVWYVEEVNDDRWLGPSFFGGGGWGEALWADPGVDRLILVVDPSTEVVSTRGAHDNNPGSLMALIYDPYEVTVDGPTETDVFARYNGTAPIGPDGEHTVTLSYRSPDGSVFTHDFYATAVEELQLGVGTNARVYDIDSVSGAVTLSDKAPLERIPARAAYNELFDTFAR